MLRAGGESSAVSRTAKASEPERESRVQVEKKRSELRYINMKRETNRRKIVWNGIHESRHIVVQPSTHTHTPA